MRLLSFFNQVETTLAMLKPECSSGWQRRVNYHKGSANYWNSSMGLCLSIHSSELGGGRYSLQTIWNDPSGASVYNHTFYCGANRFDWQSAADAVAEAMPEPTSKLTDTTTLDHNETDQAHIASA